MCPVYFESIRVADGRICHLPYHQRRVDRVSEVQLHKALASLSLPQQGVYKLRISYTPAAVLHTELSAYTPKKVDTLRLVYEDDIDYSLKREDRSALNRLHRLKGDCDDVLIIRHGRVTDTSFCNILFSDGGQWITPSTPLLEGTCRARLIEEGRVKAEEVRVEDLHKYSRFMLINALLDFDEARRKPIGNLFPHL